LGVEQADRADVLLQPLLAERDHLRGRRHPLEKLARGAVDAGVARPRGKDDGDEQRVGIDTVQLGLRIGRAPGEPAVEFGNLVPRHFSASSAAPSRSSPPSTIAVGWPTPRRKWSARPKKRPGTIAASY